MPTAIGLLTKRIDELTTERNTLAKQLAEATGRVEEYVDRWHKALDERDEARKALKPFVDFLEAFEARPIHGLDTEQIYAIHGGKYVEGGAYLGWEHLKTARAAATTKPPQSA